MRQTSILRAVGNKTITTQKAAQLLGVSDARVRQLIGEKNLLKVDKKGRDWLLDENEVRAFGSQHAGRRQA